MSAQIERRLFSVSEYYQMAEAGILKPDDRVELIDGEIIKMSPIGSLHSAVVERTGDALRAARIPKTMVRTQNPLRLNDASEPVPDLALVKHRADHYAGGHPAPEDVLLIIEVADSSVLPDRNHKVPVYVRAGIAEIWLVNLPGQVVEVYTSVDRQIFKRGEVVRSTIDELSITVDDILG